MEPGGVVLAGVDLGRELIRLGVAVAALGGPRGVPHQLCRVAVRHLLPLPVDVLKEIGTHTALLLCRV